KGSNGVASYLFHPVIEIETGAAEKYVASPVVFFAQELLDSTKTNFIATPGKPVTAEALRQIAANGIRSVQLKDTSTSSKWPTALWVPKEGRYEPFKRGVSKG